MPLFDSFHAYVYGTSFWYFLRGMARIVSPVTVIGWFRPPAEQHLPPNGLEIYTTRTDAFGLLTIALILLLISDAIPVSLSPATTLSSTSPPSSLSSTSPSKIPYAKATIWATVFHHVTTAYWAYLSWLSPDTYTKAMTVGVVGSGALAVLGVYTALVGLSAQGDRRALNAVGGGAGGKKRA